MIDSRDDSKPWQAFDEKIKDLTPSEQEAVKRFWRSLVLRSQRAFSEENGRRLPQYALGGNENGNMRSCNCCPYGYHIDLDFVRYCEVLANAKPSEDELRRRSRRRSRKSMEFMLGLESLFDQWDADERVQAVPELPHESEPDSPRPVNTPPRLNATTTTVPCYTLQRPRSSSVPRFTTYGGTLPRAESPFGTASSTCSSMRGAESDIPYTTYTRCQYNNNNNNNANNNNNNYYNKNNNNNATNSPPETRAFLRDALDEVCSDFERTLERASMKRKKATTPTTTNGHHMPGIMSYSLGSDRNNNKSATLSGYGTKRNGYAWDQSFDIFDSCVAGNKSPRASRSFTRSHTLPFQQKLSPAEQQYESYVQATVAANSKSSVEELLSTATTTTTITTATTLKQKTPPPPPPPRRHASQSKVHSPQSTTSLDCAKSPQSVEGTSALLSPLSSSTYDGNAADAQTLYNIRQQMALSLNRMKDLEEQVRTIPDMQLELSQLRADKQRLQQSLQTKQDELLRARETTRPSPSPSPQASPKYTSPIQFTPQRISPISLESLGARLRTNSVTSTSSERQHKSTLKRDVSTMCGLHATRDIAVGSPVITLRTVGTSPAQRLRITELLYTELQLNEQIEIAIKSYEEQRSLQQLKKLISVGTQMYISKRDVRDSAMQTAAERPVQKYTVGVTARPATRDNFVSCKPQMRDVGSSDHRITDILCRKCATSKRSIACSTEDTSDERSRAAVSLKLLNLTSRSNTFSLGDNEKLNIKRKTTGTQYTPTVVHSTGSQTSLAVVHSIGLQYAPELQSASTQSQAEVGNKQTDTRDLIRLVATQTSTEEIIPPAAAKAVPEVEAVPVKRMQTRDTGSNTEARKTVENGVNTAPVASTRHSGSNTETVHKRDIGCGDVVKPHISIACADNYCDSCKDAIKNLAKDFTTVVATKVAPPPSPLPTRAADSSKIPRPKPTTSPSPARKPFQRQNTYTITPSPTPSPIAEKKSLSSSLHEKPSTPLSFHQSETSNESQSFLTESTSQKLSQSTTKMTLTEQCDTEATTETVHTQQPTAAAATQDMPSFELGPLIVKEEKRVSISWSRDASPAPSLVHGKEGRKSLESSFNEKLTQALESNVMSTSVEEHSEQQQQPTEDPDVSKGARKKTSPIKSSQNKNEAQTETVEQQQSIAAGPSKALLQKLAMVEAEPRQKYTPSKELQTALKVINDSLLKKLGAKPFSSLSLKSSKATIQQEWFRISSTDKSNPHEVEDYVDYFEALSVPLLEYCVNLSDANGNTAMHYAVSHGNFDIVSILLDSKVCNVNQMNNAGYTCVMLVSLAKLKNAAHRTVVERLFQMADVNIRAKKHCQTALMLAVSHGNTDMVRMLLAAGAEINIQDEDGSTALMCAAEHGRIDIVKCLLTQPDCDSLIQDVDGSTAFKIAWQAGHRDVGLLLYVHEQVMRSKLPEQGAAGLSFSSKNTSPRQYKKQP